MPSTMLIGLLPLPAYENGSEMVFNARGVSVTPPLFTTVCVNNMSLGFFFISYRLLKTSGILVAQ